MISQSLYQALCDCADFAIEDDYSIPNSSKVENELSQFLRPYILVIHQPSGQGFYLDRGYRHIVDVENCQEPENPTKVARHYFFPSIDLPARVIRIDGISLRSEEFDTFWLY